MHRVLRHKSFQVLIAILLGGAVGFISPENGIKLKVLGDVFIRVVQLLIPPIIFLSITTGIRGSGDLKQVGRLGLKAVLYFEVVTTIALSIGLIVVHILKPGVGVSTANLAATEMIKPVETTFWQNLIPESFFGALASGHILQVLFVSVLFGIALTAVGESASQIDSWLRALLKIFFKIVEMVMIFAPLGAFGAMAFTIGKFGLSSLSSIVHLMSAVYLTMIIFIVFILGGIMRLMGFNIFKFLVYIREEIFLVLGTSSSESAFPGIIQKLERLGCPEQIVGLVIPAGYSFNLDGTSIYMSMATIFIAQAYGIDLTLNQQISILLILMLTSKGAAGVTGSGFITLAATLSATHVLPVEGMALVLGVDRFMSEARAITNLIGNGVATIFISKWEGSLTDSPAIKVK